MEIRTKRIYDAADDRDGYRVLVDRLWPRGISKDKAHVDLWARDVAPTTGLRKWFNHDAAKWDEFRRRYAGELSANAAYDTFTDGLQGHEVVTLLYGARDTEHNNAVVLKEKLEGKL